VPSTLANVLVEELQFYRRVWKSTAHLQLLVGGGIRCMFCVHCSGGFEGLCSGSGASVTLVVVGELVASSLMFLCFLLPCFLSAPVLLLRLL
jgi:hypothetical protein